MKRFLYFRLGFNAEQTNLTVISSEIRKQLTPSFSTSLMFRESLSKKYMFSGLIPVLACKLQI